MRMRFLAIIIYPIIILPISALEKVVTNKNVGQPKKITNFFKGVTPKVHLLQNNLNFELFRERVVFRAYHPAGI